jgi:hypothetical protein
VSKAGYALLLGAWLLVGLAAGAAIIEVLTR